MTLGNYLKTPVAVVRAVPPVRFITAETALPLVLR